MKLLFENWRKYLTEQADTVQVRFPDDIPPDILAVADKDPEISGFVSPEEHRERAGIYFNNELVGFMTPRMESAGWRVGAIYISPDYRGKGIGSKAIIKFFEDKDASQVPIGVNNAPAQKAFATAGFSLIQPDEILTDENDGWKYQLWSRSEPENTQIKGPEDFLYDITTSSDRIIITLLDPETKEPVESKKEDTNAYISLEKRTDVPHWEVSWSSSPENSEKVGTIMYLMALELAEEGLSPDSYETSPDAGYIWAKFMTKNVYGVKKEKKEEFEHEGDDNHFFFVFFKPKKDILEKYRDKITYKEAEGKEKVAFDPESEEKFEKYVSHEDEDFDWEELDYIEENTAKNGKNDENDVEKVSKVVIYKKSGQILLLKRSDGRNDWDLPGGHLKKGESYEEGAARETKEETNLRISGLKPVSTHKHIHFFKVKAPKGKIQLQKEEHVDYKWVNPKKIDQFDLRKSLKDAILDAIGLVQEQTEPYAQWSRSTYRVFITKLGRQGKNKYNVGGKMKKPSAKHLKSAPPGA